jgi:hypothetical protein
MRMSRNNKQLTRNLSTLFVLFVIFMSSTLAGCSFFVPAYENPDSKQYEKQKEKAHEELKNEDHNDPVPK